jgi:peptidoglycan/xylan/chitin deacetylase (PgdA/CDA1 family)
VGATSILLAWGWHTLTRGRGYRIALASVPPLDTILSDDLMAANIRAMSEAGSIIVLHDGDDRGRRTLATLEQVLPELKARGLAVLTLSELDALANEP